MAYHPVNLGVRFLLELAAVLIMGYWGWQNGEGALRFVLAIGIPIGAFAIWTIFAVPNDLSRNGEAPVPVPGILRLIYELIFFGFAVWALFNLRLPALGIVFGIIVLAHYVISFERVGWLIGQS